MLAVEMEEMVVHKMELMEQQTQEVGLVELGQV